MSTVTIEKDYFETLLRRAQFHASGVDFSTPVNLLTVTIPKIDHDNLLALSREYANLRRNLYKGGVNDETLAILINDDNDPLAHNTTNNITTNDSSSETETLMTQTPIPSSQYTPISKHGGYSHGYGRQYYGTGYQRQPRNNYEDFSPVNEGQGDYFNNGNGTENWYGNGNADQDGQLLKNAKRTIQITNLPEWTTHNDITNIVRGGMLLDIFLRSNDRTVAVSFVDEHEANDFFRHAKRNDLYVKGKRVNVQWADRHFTLPNHVANKIRMGATRNIVIRFAHARQTEEAIRDDLEHIHNLVVVRVTFAGRDAHISTNSVHNAMFARTCMMSRSKYKGSRIEWDIDECAGPVKQPAPKVRKEKTSAKKTAPINRFELLNIDGTEDSSFDEAASGLSFRSDFTSTLNGVTV